LRAEDVLAIHSSDACRGISMLKFTKLKQDAQDLSLSLTGSYCSQMGCFSFFSSFIPISSDLEDAWTIGMVARCMHSDYDTKLQRFLTCIMDSSEPNFEALLSFKCKVLIGIYLFVWSHYNSVPSNLKYKSLIRLFQHNLGIRSVQDMDEQVFQASLSSLSLYSSFIYEHRLEHSLFDDLNKRLGPTIQADIETARNAQTHGSSSWLEVCSGVLCHLGINKIS
jgi:hypothetical protein